MISLSAKALSPMEGAEFPSIPLHGTVKMCLSINQGSFNILLIFFNAEPG